MMATELIVYDDTVQQQAAAALAASERQPRDPDRPRVTGQHKPYGTDWVMRCELHGAHVTTDSQELAFEVALGHLAMWHPSELAALRSANRTLLGTIYRLARKETS